MGSGGVRRSAVGRASLCLLELVHEGVRRGVMVRVPVLSRAIQVLARLGALTRAEFGLSPVEFGERVGERLEPQTVVGKSFKHMQRSLVCEPPSPLVVSVELDRGDSAIDGNSVCRVMDDLFASYSKPRLRSDKPDALSALATSRYSSAVTSSESVELSWSMITDLQALQRE